MAVQRLDKVLASTGKWSRREVKMLVRQGRVLVDGVPAASPEQKVDPDAVQLCVNGEEIAYRRYTWLMLNKPAGYLSATSDGRGATVLDLLPQELQRLGLFPVGRLDKDTEGLLLITDDGALSHALMSPNRHVEKEYEAVVDGALAADAVSRFEQGMTLRDGTECKSAKLEILETEPELRVRVTLKEGKYHQVKRMIAAVGGTVTALKRLRLGGLWLDKTLAPGEFRELTQEELEKLTSQT